MVKVLVMSGYGINCERESAYAFETAGAIADIVHINDLISKAKRMSDYDILMFPGGFSYGDDTGSGNAFANKVKNNLWEELLDLISSKKLILGVCNGFQVMINLGLFSLDGKSYGRRSSALVANTQNRYEARWVNIRSRSERCIFTKGIDIAPLPVAHGEGRFCCDEKTYEALKANDQIVFTYCSQDGKDADGRYPENPNGSMHDVCGLCDSTGRVMGMMPHPERALFSESDPSYHKRKLEENLPEHIQANYLIFRNAVQYFG